MALRNLDLSRHRGSLGSGEAMAKSLGWFSIGLGAAEFLMPGAFAAALGMRRSRTLIAAYGVREIANGIALLNADDPTPFVWGRVGGDGLDLLTLAAGLVGRNRRKGSVLVAMLAVGGITALDLLCAQAVGAKPSYRKSTAPYRDYSDRSGFPKPAAEMRGAARTQATGPARPPERPSPSQPMPAGVAGTKAGLTQPASV